MVVIDRASASESLDHAVLLVLRAEIDVIRQDNRRPAAGVKVHKARAQSEMSTVTRIESRLSRPIDKPPSMVILEQCKAVVAGQQDVQVSIAIIIPHCAALPVTLENL